MSYVHYVVSYVILKVPMLYQRYTVYYLIYVILKVRLVICDVEGIVRSLPRESGWLNQGYAWYIVPQTYTEKVGLIDWREFI